MGLLNKFRKEGQKKNLENEVIDNLASLLNTKQGYGAWQRGLGLKGYSSGKSRAAIIEQIVDDIRYNIENFEKRIKITEILVIDNKNVFNLQLQIKCQVGGRFHSYYIGFKQPQDPIEVEEEAWIHPS